MLLGVSGRVGAAVACALLVSTAGAAAPAHKRKVAHKASPARQKVPREEVVVPEKPRPVQLVDDPRWGMLAELVGKDLRPRGFNTWIAFRAVSPTEIGFTYVAEDGGKISHAGARLGAAGLEYRQPDDDWRPTTIDGKGRIKVQPKGGGKYYVAFTKVADRGIFWGGALLASIENDARWRQQRDTLVATGMISPPGTGAPASLAAASGVPTAVPSTPYLGMAVAAVAPDSAKKGNPRSTSGALITEVLPGGPADEVGLRNGDVVVSIDGRLVRDAAAISNAVASAPAGTSFRLGIMREGKRQNILLASALRPAGLSGAAGSMVPGSTAAALATMGNEQWAKFGLFGRLVGTYWEYAKPDKYDRVLRFDVRTEGNQRIYFDQIWRGYKYQVTSGFAYMRPGDDKVLYNSSFMTDHWYKLDDGTIYQDIDGTLWSLDNPDVLRVTKGKLVNGKFVPKDPPQSWSYNRLKPDQVLALRTELNNRNEQKMAAKSQGGGDSGLFGALAMGLGAAIAGGNAEQVMGMAMKGAELTSDNEMTRSVLSGQGDAMVAAGTARMIEKAVRANSVASGGMDAGGTEYANGTSGTSPARRGSGTTATAKGASAASTMVRYSFCTDSRVDRSTGKIREVIFYSQIGTIRPGPNGGIDFPKGFADFVDTQTPLARLPMSENCPLFPSVAEAERDLALKRQIERPGIRDFIYLSSFVPR
jgi:hypothetical protein